jgi:ATP-binding cassette subfamily C (CFTR/MRP) protein 1
MTYIHMLWSAPLQISLSMLLLWNVLGPSSLAGLGVMVVMIPLNGYIARKTRKLQVQQMAQKDSRIKEMNEV